MVKMTMIMRTTLPTTWDETMTDAPLPILASENFLTDPDSISFNWSVLALCFLRTFFHLFSRVDSWIIIIQSLFFKKDSKVKVITEQLEMFALYFGFCKWGKGGSQVHEWGVREAPRLNYVEEESTGWPEPSQDLSNTFFFLQKMKLSISACV